MKAVICLLALLALVSYVSGEEELCMQCLPCDDPGSCKVGCWIVPCTGGVGTIIRERAMAISAHGEFSFTAGEQAANDRAARIRESLRSQLSSMSLVVADDSARPYRTLPWLLN